MREAYIKNAQKQKTLKYNECFSCKMSFYLLNHVFTYQNMLLLTKTYFNLLEVFLAVKYYRIWFFSIKIFPSTKS